MELNYIIINNNKHRMCKWARDTFKVTDYCWASSNMHLSIRSYTRRISSDHWTPWAGITAALSKAKGENKSLNPAKCRSNEEVVFFLWENIEEWETMQWERWFQMILDSHCRVEHLVGIFHICNLYLAIHHLYQISLWAVCHGFV